MFIILTLLLTTLHGAAQTFGSINIPQHLCAGRSATVSFGLNSDFDITIDTFSATISRADRAFLPDGVPCNGSCSYTSPINISGYAPDATITSVNDIKYIRLNMEHSYIGDIYIGITCPNNHSATIMKLSGGGTNSDCASSIPSNRRGWSSGSNTNYSTYFGVPVDGEASSNPCNASLYANRPGTGWNYCWSNNTNSGYVYAGGTGSLVYRSANSNYTPSSSWIKTVDSSNVAAGTQFYKPDQNFSSLIGCQLNGNWTIEVIDAWEQDNGYIFEWELSLAPGLRPTQCGVDSTLIISPYVEYMSDSTFVINAPSNITADTTIYLTLRILNTCGDTIDSMVPIYIHTDLETNIYDTACNSYVWYGHTFSSTTVAQVHLTSRQYSCDSLVYMHLQIYNSSDTTIIDTILENELPYISGLDSLIASGEYTFNHSSVHGCDSTVNISLTVWPNSSVTIDTTLCRHMLPIQYNGSILTTAEPLDTIVFNLLDTHGADSTVYLVLHILPDNDTSIIATAVQNNLPVFECGTNWYHSTDTTLMLSNIYGCDSTIHYSLTVWNNVTFESDTTVCINQLPMEWHNQLFTEGTTMTLNLLTVNGADSTVTLTMRTNPVYNIGVYTTICDNLLPYSYLDSSIYQQQTNPTSYLFNLNTINGCDSIITLNLTVLSTSDTIIVDTVVENNLPVFECGINWYNSTDTTLTLSNIYGCDSTIHYTLTIWSNVAFAFDTTVCINQLPMTWHNQTFTEDTTMTLNLLTVNGADSTVTLTMRTNPIYNIGVYTTICDNLLPYTYLDSTITQQQTNPTLYLFNLNTINGCDSIITLNLTVMPTSDTTIVDTVVENNLPVFECGINWQQTVDTTIIFSNIYGCDSSIHYSLTVWPNIALTFDTTVCINQLPMTWKNQMFTTDTTMTLNLLTVNGADSIVTLTLRTNPTYNTSVDTTLCDNQLPLIYLDTTINMPQTKISSYTFNLNTIYGCDSIVTLNLTVLQTSDTTIFDTVVQNNLPHSFNNTSFTNSGSWQFHTINAVGCDSTIYYNLHVWANDTTWLDTTVCSNHAPFTWHNVTFSSTSTIVVTHQDIHGADSVMILNVTVPPAYDTSLAVDICDNEYYNLGRTLLNVAGHYDTTLYTKAHCDSVIHLDLMVYPTYSQHFYDTTCRTTAYRFLDTVYNESGTYTHNLPTSHGCDSLMTLHLALKGINLKAIAQISPLIPTIENKHITLRDISHDAIDRLWIVDNYESHQKNISIEYPEEFDSIEAMLIAFSDDGCTDTVTNTIRIDRAVIFAPNAFTPNQADNSRWSLFGQQIATLEVWIYNREGLLVYHYEGADGSWDGRSQNGENNCPQGAYVYRANYTTLLHPSRKQTITGTILLIR